MRGIALLTILFCLLLPAGASAETPAAVFVRLASPEAVHDARLAEHEQARLHLEKTGIATASLVVTPEEAKAELIRVARAGAELVAALSPDLFDAAVAAAAAAPKTVFFVLSDREPPDSLSVFAARMWEGWYVAGRSAARREGGIGWLAPVDEAGRLSPDQERDLHAFVRGVRSVRPQGQVTLLRTPTTVPRDEAAAADALARLAGRIRQDHQNGPALIVAPPFVAEAGNRAASAANVVFLPGPTCDWTRVYGSLLVQIRFGLWRHRATSYGMREGVVRFDPPDGAPDPEAIAFVRGAKPFPPGLDDAGQETPGAEETNAPGGLRDITDERMEN